MRVLGVLGLVFALAGCATLMDDPTPLELGSRRELFVDSHLIARLDGAVLELHQPQRAGTALPLDAPWEGPYSAYPTVIQDGDVYRMYYRGSSDQADGGAGEVTCCAESDDGVVWRKPSLGLYNVDGSTANNVVLAGDPPFSHNFTPFLDTRPGVPESERYKAVAGLADSGLVAFVSPDGLRWSKLRDEPILTDDAFDSQNVAFWSEAEGRYVCYFRSFRKVGGDTYRWISRSTSQDFLQWTPRVMMDLGETDLEQLYTNATQPYFRAPHIYVALPQRLLITDLGAEEVRAAETPPYISDCVFMTSRGGNAFDRTFRDPFIPAGYTSQDRTARNNMAAVGVAPGTERAMYLYRLSYYGGTGTRVDRYTLRPDGFASVSAPAGGGELLTKPLLFTGSRLELNYAAAAGGSVSVEIQSWGREKIPGYTLEENVPLTEDEIDAVATWQSGSDLTPLIGRPVRLRFVLVDAELYSVKFG